MYFLAWVRVPLNGSEFPAVGAGGVLCLEYEARQAAELVRAAVHRQGGTEPGVPYPAAEFGDGLLARVAHDGAGVGGELPSECGSILLPAQYRTEYHGLVNDGDAVRGDVQLEGVDRAVRVVRFESAVSLFPGIVPGHL